MGATTWLVLTWVLVALASITVYGKRQKVVQQEPSQLARQASPLKGQGMTCLDAGGECLLTHSWCHFPLPYFDDCSHPTAICCHRRMEKGKRKKKGDIEITKNVVAERENGRENSDTEPPGKIKQRKTGSRIKEQMKVRGGRRDRNNNLDYQIKTRKSQGGKKINNKRKKGNKKSVIKTKENTEYGEEIRKFKKTNEGKMKKDRRVNRKIKKDIKKYWIKNKNNIIRKEKEKSAKMTQSFPDFHGIVDINSRKGEKKEKKWMRKGDEIYRQHKFKKSEKKERLQKSKKKNVKKKISNENKSHRDSDKDKEGKKIHKERKRTIGKSSRHSNSWRRKKIKEKKGPGGKVGGQPGRDPYDRAHKAMTHWKGLSRKTGGKPCRNCKRISHNWNKLDEKKAEKESRKSKSKSHDRRKSSGKTDLVKKKRMKVRRKKTHNKGHSIEKESSHEDDYCMKQVKACQRFGGSCLGKGKKCKHILKTFRFGSCHPCKCCKNTCKAKKKCRIVGGSCRKSCVKEEREVKKGCKGGKCKCCAPECYVDKKCKKKGGTCKKQCSSGEQRIKKGCRQADCRCCVPSHSCSAKKCKQQGGVCKTRCSDDDKRNSKGCRGSNCHCCVKTRYGIPSPKTQGGKIFCMFYSLIGCSSGILFFNHFLERITMILAFILRGRQRWQEQKRAKIEAKKARKAGKGKINRSRWTDPDQEDLDLNAYKPSIYWNLLVLSILSVVVSAFGAFIYMEVEGWTYLDSLYYCFVSFSTLGFGDFISVEELNESYGPGLYAYSFFNVVMLVMGGCCIYSFFNIMTTIITKFLDFIIKRTVSCCDREQHTPTHESSKHLISVAEAQKEHIRRQKGDIDDIYHREKREHISVKKVRVKYYDEELHELVTFDLRHNNINIMNLWMTNKRLELLQCLSP
nr:uncharacterized protein LOC128689625 [Cherax quadricarinatus]